MGSQKFEATDYDTERVFYLASLTGHVEVKCEPNRLKRHHHSLTLSNCLIISHTLSTSFGTLFFCLFLSISTSEAHCISKLLWTRDPSPVISFLKIHYCANKCF